MYASPSLLLRLLALLLLAHAGAARAAPPDEVPRPEFAPQPPPEILRSSSSSLAPFERSQPDTFVLFGGPGTRQGKFENSLGQPELDGWTPVDLTDTEPRWQRSTYNAANLGGHGPGNRAMWCGADDPLLAWVAPPGYGNAWNETLLYESDPVADPSVGQTIALDFVFNLDTEPEWDFFHVEYESATVWIPVLEIDGTNKIGDGVFEAPGLRFSDVATSAIVYTGSDYGLQDRIRIRLRFSSDGAFSDEDGFFDGEGAVQLDDITLTTSQGSFTEDFEGPGPYLFEPARQPFYGDFADVYPILSDLDPCRGNDTPVVGFIDYGQVVRNGPGIDGSTSTGGSTSTEWGYGIDGDYVVNITGGLDPYNNLDGANEVWSPVIEWDFPGTDDDGPDVIGALLEFDAWLHNPLLGYTYWVWHVRSRSEGGEWSQWRDPSFVNYSQTPRWRRVKLDVSYFLVENVAQVQVALGMFQFDFGFGLPFESTPAPWYDNVRFTKYRVPGPLLWQSASDRVQDAFPSSGLVSNATQAERDLLDVPFGAASTVGSAVGRTTIGTELRIPGTAMDEMVMVWLLRRNAHFEDAIRALPSGPFDRNVTVDGSLWMGEVVMQPVQPSSNVYFAELPDEDFLYPGDVLQYYFKGTDDGGRITTLPADVSGFGEFYGLYDETSAYDHAYTVRGLPTLGTVTNTAPTASIALEETPHALVVNDIGAGAEQDFLIEALSFAGYRPGYNIDVLNVQSPDDEEARRLAIGPGAASLAQLDGYDTIIFVTRSGGPAFDADLALIDSWRDGPSAKVVIWSGDDFVSMLPGDYAQEELGLELTTTDAWEDTGSQDMLRVAPSPALDLNVAFAIETGCPSLKGFNGIRPTLGEPGHAFLQRNGTPIYQPVASVVHARAGVGGFLNVDITLPYALDRIRGGGPFDHTVLAGQVLMDLLLFAGTYDGEGPDSAPSSLRPELTVAPTPFNPSTNVHFVLPEAGPGSVRIYDVRGNLVRTLADGLLAAGPNRFVWNGLDDRERRVGSGVYLVRAMGAGAELTKKIALVK